MTLLAPLPVWALMLIGCAAAWLAWRAASVRSRRHGAASWRRIALAGLRLIALLAPVVLLMRPVWMASPPGEALRRVAVLVDASKSMELPDAEGVSRIATAARLVEGRLAPLLRGHSAVDRYTFGTTLRPVGTVTDVQADEASSDLTSAQRALRASSRVRPLSAIVVVSDGAFTSPAPLEPAEPGDPPIFVVPVGAPVVDNDREILQAEVGDTTVTESSADLTATVISHRATGERVDLLLLADGRPADRREVRLEPGVPTPVVFQVQPDRDRPTVYALRVTASADEPTTGNNERSLLAPGATRTRRILVVEGAPGFEHSFLKRALERDAGFRVDAVTRKGLDAKGSATFYVQVAPGQEADLARGFPGDRRTLFQYDAVVLANLAALSREQAELTAAFVGERGGGLLLLGSRTFAPDGLVGGSLRPLLPVDLSSRSWDVARAAGTGTRIGQVTVTPDGLRHPVMRLGDGDPEAIRARWAALPPLSATASVGGPSPGATVLATFDGPGGVVRPALAVQRYGEGRVAAFTGEASWRWRMHMPSDDRTYETFWRQAVRWVAASAEPPVSASATIEEGGDGRLRIRVRDDEFRAIRDAHVEVRVAPPGAAEYSLTARPDPAREGDYEVRFDGSQPGLYSLGVEARTSGRLAGTAETAALGGGTSLELRDPRRRDDALAAVARAGGGRVLDPGSLDELPSLLGVAVSRDRFEPREAWHSPWVFLFVAVALSLEWALRRRWGLR